MHRLTPSVLVFLLCFLALTARAHSPIEAAHEMNLAATDWLAALAPEQRALAAIDFTNEERENWHYVPKPREGLPLAKMNDDQRRLARLLLATGLSQHGLMQAESVIALERVLRAMEGSAHRDETLYYFSVFGKPSDRETWGWRVEGHHLSVNFTLIDGQRLAATPNFFGANPAEVTLAGPQIGKRVLAAEEDLGRAFVTSLNRQQRKQAIVAERAPGDILTRNEPAAKPLQPAGLAFSGMNPDQQNHFQALVALYANRLRPEVAEWELKKIADSGWERLSFAWAGSIEPGQGHYYRIQSPDFVIEYDDTQNSANHIHTVWRSFAGDFGRDLLREHYGESHPAK